MQNIIRSKDDNLSNLQSNRNLRRVFYYAVHRYQ